MEHAIHIDPLERMGPKIVALGLYEIGTDSPATVRIYVLQCIGKGRHGNALLNGQASRIAEELLSLIDLIQKELIEHEIV